MAEQLTDTPSTSDSLLHFKGLTELGQILDSMPPKMEKNVTTRAMRAGAKLVQQEAVNNLAKSSKSGELARGIKVRARVKGGRVSVFIRTTGKHSYIARWLEWGVKAHLIGAKRTAGGRFAGLSFLGIFRTVIHHPGFTAESTRFMRPALDAKAAAAIVAMAEATKKILEKKEGLDVPDTEVEYVV